MAVGLRVRGQVWLLGSADFVRAFFSTVGENLEPGGWGSRFPAVMNPLYEGQLSADLVSQARDELSKVRAELASHPVDDLVWDVEDRSAKPPWGDNISEEITSLADYFVTMDGRDMFEVMHEALAFAEQMAYEVTLKSVGVVTGEGGITPADRAPSRP